MGRIPVEQMSAVACLEYSAHAPRSRLKDNDKNKAYRLQNTPHEAAKYCLDFRTTDDGRHVAIQAASVPMKCPYE